MGAKRGAAPSKARSPVLMRPSADQRERGAFDPGRRPDPSILFHFYTPMRLDFVHRLTKISSASDSSPRAKLAQTARADIFKLYFSWKGSMITTVSKILQQKKTEKVCNSATTLHLLQSWRAKKPMS